MAMNQSEAHSHQYLNFIHSPEDFKKIPKEEIPFVAEEIRKELVRITSKNGGHLASNLGVVEMTMAIFGSNPQKVTAYRTKDAVTATVRFDGFDVTNHFNEGNYHYSATIYTKDQTVFKELDVSKIYQHECDAFVRMLRTGEMEQTYEELVMPVAYIAAIEKAYETGEEQKIEPILI